MALVVQKFGGTSVADADRIRAVADHVARTRRPGDEVVVVVSAMGKTTDDLLRLADDVSSVQPAARVDMLLTLGRADLDGAAVHGAGRPRGRGHRPSPGSQAGIITDTDHTRAKIVEVRADRLRATLDGGRCRWWPGSRACRPTGT